MSLRVDSVVLRMVDGRVVSRLRSFGVDGLCFLHVYLDLTVRREPFFK